VKRTFDALADANDDAQELDEAVRSGMNLSVGVAVLLDDEDAIDAELVVLQTRAIAEARAEDKTLKPETSEETRHEDVSETGAVC
jgi:hypothetical protein